MKVKKTRPLVGRVRVEMKEQEGLSLHYYTVTLMPDGTFVASQQPGESPSSKPENTSTLALGQFKVALQITWFPAKPAPDSPARREGLLAVMDDIVSQLPEDQREQFKNSLYGVGHAYGARIEQTEENDG